VKLFSNGGAQRYYRGVVRNVESALDPELPNAGARVGDVAAVEAAAFLEQLKHRECYLLHLAEGRDDRARQHFLDLEIEDDTWAVTGALAGIHAVALTPADFKVLHRLGASIVWSPLSNLLLYGKTADVRAARANHVRIGLGSDWSFTGSKNLLGELKAARLVSEAEGGVFTDRDLVAMATRDAAAILRWDGALGSLEPRKRADLLVVSGNRKEPYAQLLESTEADIRLVAIDGVARYGTSAFLKALTGSKVEAVTVGGEERALNLVDAAGDPDVGELTLKEATRALTKALKDLPKLARELKAKPKPSVAPEGVAPERPSTAAAEAATRAPTWFLALDELVDPGAVRAQSVQAADVGTGDTADATDASDLDTLTPEAEAARVVVATVQAAADLADVVRPMALDPLTVVDDAEFLDRIGEERNLPDYVRKGLRRLYR
jgi:hypothetical protein